MKIIFGLGNYGRDYAGTRHNMGFDTVARLADRLGVSLDTKRFKGLYGSTYIGGEKVLLVQPQTYMNNSGECVREMLDFFKLDASDILVIYDDISLDPGALRLRAKGSAGGHNGIKNIIAHLGGDTFDRIRIGVGEKPERYDLVDWVLGRFDSETRQIIDEAIDEASRAAEVVVTDGLERAMNLYNKKPEKK